MQPNVWRKACITNVVIWLLSLDCGGLLLKLIVRSLFSMFRNSDGDVKNLAIINVYVPRVDSERDDRKEYKLRFLTLLQTRAEALLKEGKYASRTKLLQTTVFDVITGQGLLSRKP